MNNRGLLYSLPKGIWIRIRPYRCVGATAFGVSQKTTESRIQRNASKRKLNNYLADIDKQAEEMFSQLIEKDGEK